MKRVVIYNPTQINVFLHYDVKPIKCIITKSGDKPPKMGLLFEVTPKFEEIMKRWQSNEFKNTSQFNVWRKDDLNDRK